jgi:hypothetical protein
MIFLMARVVITVTLLIALALQVAGVSRGLKIRLPEEQHNPEESNHVLKSRDLEETKHVDSSTPDGTVRSSNGTIGMMPSISHALDTMAGKFKPDKKTMSQFDGADKTLHAYRQICAAPFAKYTTVEGDTAVTIVKRFFPDTNQAVDTWGLIVMCNEKLQGSYYDSPKVDDPVPLGLTLSIPNATATVEYLANYTMSLYNQANLTPDSNCGCSPSKYLARDTGILKAAATFFGANISATSQLNYVAAELMRCNPNMKRKGGVILKGQRLRGICVRNPKDGQSIALGNQIRRAEVTSRQLYSFDPNAGINKCNSMSNHKTRDSGISGYPDCVLSSAQSTTANWDYYNCVPSYSFDNWATLTIITGNDNFCQEQWNRAVDGCSSPVWSAFTNDFQAACNKHDLCYWFSYRSGRSYSVDQRRACDVSFKADMVSICDWFYSQWYNGITKGFCYATAGVWGDAVWNAQGSNPTTPISINPGYLYRAWANAYYRLPGNIQYMTSFRSDPGVIRSQMNGKCIDSGNGNAGNQLFMYDCNWGWNQIFVRPNPWDLRLKLKDRNLCLDVANSGGAGTPVILYSCGAGSNQEWIYDDLQRLKPKYNTNLCLDVLNADVNNMAKLGVWYCGGLAANQMWSL